MSIRKASHAGSWYSDNANELNDQLTGWLNRAKYTHGPAKAIISPHAGYYYCGATAAFGFKHINPELVDTVFILGPSHHYRLSGCALTQTAEYETPLYNLIIDQEINNELFKTGKFEWMSIKTDEDEHSIEMQLSFLAKVMESKKGNYKVVPIMVGNTSSEKEKMYGEMLAKYFLRPKTIFIISSDFCHWGERFAYTYYDQSHGEIWKSIQALDKMGMDLIETLQPVDFKNYLREYDNTICGNHPISVFLHLINSLENKNNYNMKFVDYSQSSKCKTRRDSSVSYASATLVDSQN
ncbi:unnamed protein product [Brachionus calyciflorus]|uniref:MEMO1 n=1 Tax=Brachionus calyciflorus TaxID=104777 RepID=A0A813PPH1_9BILA|nr:unnamed protein product [Brachionus calyciflorus]